MRKVPRKLWLIQLREAFVVRLGLLQGRKLEAEWNRGALVRALPGL